MAGDASSSVRASIHTLVAKIYSRMERFEKSVESAKSAIKASGTFAEAYYWLGYGLDKLDQGRDARDALEEAARLDTRGTLAKAAKRKIKRL